MEEKFRFVHKDKKELSSKWVILFFLFGVKMFLHH